MDSAGPFSREVMYAPLTAVARDPRYVHLDGRKLARDTHASLNGRRLTHRLSNNRGVLSAAPRCSSR